MIRSGSSGSRRRRGLSGALLAGVLASLVLAGSALASHSALTQKPGAAGCIAEAGTNPACTDGTALHGSGSVALSPDGDNAYVATQDSDAVTIFDRDPATGGLTQKAGTAGCISETGTLGACGDGRALDSAETVTVSPDGASVYVGSRLSDAIAIFDRNTTTGELTQKAGTAGCISETGTAGACVDGVALDAASTVTVSPDGANLYVASRFSDAVAIFDRNITTGALTQKPGTAACISEDGTAGACADGTALDFAISVAVSPDGTGAYVASQDSGAVTIFDRDTTTGELTQKAGTAGCISETGTAGACADGTALDGAGSVTVSPDGASAYVASQVSGAVTAFDRNAATGALTQKPGTAGCISDDGTAGACINGVGLVGVRSVAVSPDGASAYGASIDSDAVAVFDRSTNTGILTQETGRAGCIAEDGIGPCVEGNGFDGAEAVTVSPDGKNAYAAAALSDSVLVFDRGLEPKTKITKKPKSRIKTTKKKVKVKVSFKSEADAIFKCKLDDANYKRCTSPYIVKAKSKGGKGRKHTISIRATVDGLVGKPAVIKFKVIRKG